MFEYMTNPYS